MERRGQIRLELGADLGPRTSPLKTLPGIDAETKSTNQPNHSTEHGFPTSFKTGFHKFLPNRNPSGIFPRFHKGILRIEDQIVTIS